MKSTGNRFNFKSERGALIEYTISSFPLMLEFEFNPSSITRTRSVTINSSSGAPGNRGGYDFFSPSEVARAAQGVSVSAESFSLKILLDATDRMNSGDPTATALGVQPEIDTIRSMLEPKQQSENGAKILSALGFASPKAVSHHKYPSVLLFKWGVQLLPVFMTRAQIEIKEYLPSLIPYRAEVTMDFQIIESSNPFYDIEMKRQKLFSGKLSGVAQDFIFRG